MQKQSGSRSTTRRTRNTSSRSRFFPPRNSKRQIGGTIWCGRFVFECFQKRSSAQLGWRVSNTETFENSRSSVHKLSVGRPSFRVCSPFVSPRMLLCTARVNVFITLSIFFSFPRSLHRNIVQSPKMKKQEHKGGGGEETRRGTCVCGSAGPNAFCRPRLGRGTQLRKDGPSQRDLVRLTTGKQISPRRVVEEKEKKEMKTNYPMRRGPQRLGCCTSYRPLSFSLSLSYI